MANNKIEIMKKCFIILVMELLFQSILHVIAMDSTNCTFITNLLENPRSASDNPQMRFYLYTRTNLINEQEINVNNSKSITLSNFNVDWPVRIMIHGWRGEHMSCANAFIKDAYLKKGNFNVLITDWSDWSKSLNYFETLRLVDSLFGESLAKLILFLNREANVSFDNITLIGHSIGAHIAGAAGQLILPNQFNAIFALDPAGFGFQFNEPNQRLDKNDAKYVETITTSMGTFGYEGQIGHGNFYPNYGRIQNYCNRFESSNAMCNHLAAVRYFAESITSSIGFCAKKCDYIRIVFRLCGNAFANLNEIDSDLTNYMMGGDPPIMKLGTFYLRTDDKEPFAGTECSF